MISPNQARINLAAFASVAALSLASCGSSFGERCREVFTDPFDVDDCVTRLSNGGSLRPPTHNPSKGD